MSLLEDERLDGTSLTGVIPLLRPQQCKGHFPLMPALPVSILMHALSGLSGRLLARRLDRPGLRYSVERAEVTADNLAFAGERIVFRARHAVSDASGHEFECDATGPENRSVGTMRIRLAVVD